MDGSDLNAANVDSVLEHFGVKGMKWGVRKMSSGSSSSGGSDHGHSEDAKNAAAAHEKLKSGGTHVLSNKELQDLVKRMQLEQQFVDLNGKKATPAHGKKAAKFVGDFLVNFGKQEAGKILSAIVAKQLKGKIPGLK